MATKMPTYSIMALNAVACLPNRAGKGVSLPKIKEQITEMYSLSPINKTALSNALAKGVTAGDLVKVKASYKLSDDKKNSMPSKAKILTAAKNAKEGTKPAPKKKPPAKKAAAEVKVSLIPILLYQLFSNSCPYYRKRWGTARKQRPRRRPARRKPS